MTEIIKNMNNSNFNIYKFKEGCFLTNISGSQPLVELLNVNIILSVQYPQNSNQYYNNSA